MGNKDTRLSAGDGRDIVSQPRNSRVSGISLQGDSWQEVQRGMDILRDLYDLCFKLSGSGKFSFQLYERYELQILYIPSSTDDGGWRLDVPRFSCTHRFGPNPALLIQKEIERVLAALAEHDATMVSAIDSARSILQGRR